MSVLLSTGFAKARDQRLQNIEASHKQGDQILLDGYNLRAEMLSGQRLDNEIAEQNGDGLAADWIAQQFVRMGVKPLKTDHFQPFQFNVNSFPDSMRVSLDGTLLTPGVDYIVDPASGSASGAFNLVHLRPEDVLDPARRGMAMATTVPTGRGPV